MIAVEMASTDTNVRVDRRDPAKQHVDLVLYTERGAVRITGTGQSIAMLADRINDRVDTSRLRDA